MDASAAAPSTPCPRCGHAVRPDVAGGLCPSCGADPATTPPVARATTTTVPPPPAPMPGTSMPPPPMVPAQFAAGGVSQSADAHFLQRAGRYLTARNKVVSSATWSIVWGAINLSIGLTALATGNILGAIVVLLGILQLTVGIWVVVAPSPVGVIADGILFALLALVNFGAFLLNGAGGGIILAIIQVAFSVRSFASYSSVAAIWESAPGGEYEGRMRQIFETIRKGKVKSNPMFVAFNTTTASRNMAWRGLIDGDRVILILNGQEEIVVVPAGSLAIDELGKKMASRNLKVTVAFPGHQHNGSIDPDSLARLRAWIAGTWAVPGVPQPAPM